MPRALRLLALVSLIILLGIELLTSYDTGPRQLALSLTNLAAIVVMLWLGRLFDRASAGLYALLAVAVALGVWFDALGNFVHFYGRFLWWDKLAHGFGTAAVSVGFAALLARLESRGALHLKPGLHVLFAVALGMLAASVYEVSELIGDQLFHLERIIDLYDTADDLMWNLIASIPAAALTVWVARRGSP